MLLESADIATLSTTNITYYTILLTISVLFSWLVSVVSWVSLVSLDIIDIYICIYIYWYHHHHHHHHFLNRCSAGVTSMRRSPKPRQSRKRRSAQRWRHAAPRLTNGPQLTVSGISCISVEKFSNVNIGQRYSTVLYIYTYTYSMIDYSTIMSHFHSRTDSHNSGRAQLCFFLEHFQHRWTPKYPEVSRTGSSKAAGRATSVERGAWGETPRWPTPRQLGTFHGWFKKEFLCAKNGMALMAGFLWGALPLFWVHSESSCGSESVWLCWYFSVFPRYVVASKPNIPWCEYCEPCMGWVSLTHTKEESFLWSPCNGRILTRNPPPKWG